MKKRIIVFVAMLFVVFSFALISAQESYVCCEKTKYGYCQDILRSESEDVCTGTVSETSCSGGGTFDCRIGVCVNESEGICAQNTPKLVCEKNEGVWHDEDDADNIPVCQKGCCQIGTSSSFVTDIECTRQSIVYEVPKKFRSDIKDESSCQELADSTEIGACVHKGVDGSSPCTMNDKESCRASKGQFHKGLLCTAEGLSDCTKSSKTICKGDDVYFLDMCGNLANVFDAKKIKDNDYWEKIQDPKCYGDNSYGKYQCGDCDYAEGSKCIEEKGKSICGDLSCKDSNGKTKEHGESWCAGTSGVSTDIDVDPFDHSFLKKDTRNKLESGFQKLNLPGSRYYKLLCWEGEIIQEDCMDYRNAICKETILNGDFTSAQCWVNRWRECFDLDDKTACEDKDMDCKWLGGQENYWGYRFDGARIKYNGEDLKQKKEREEKQGSCVPLYAPGFDFWRGPEAVMDASAICSMGKVVESATFETRVNRDKFAGWSTKAAASRCFEGACYALPDYGLDKKLSTDLNQILKVHRGHSAPDKLQNIYLSSRKGYYCHKKGDENASLTGSTGGFFSNDKKAKCADSGRKRKDIPLFLNHGVWIDFIQERARSLGDCGYKTSFAGDKGQETSEVMTAVFQKLTQKGKVKDNESAKTKNIYIGDRRVTEDEEYRRSGVYDSNNKAPFYWRNYAWWKKLHPGEKPNMGEKNSVKTSTSGARGVITDTDDAEPKKPGVYGAISKIESK